MAHPFKHAESSARRFGGNPEDYLAIHNWLALIWTTCQSRVPMRIMGKEIVFKRSHLASCNGVCGEAEVRAERGPESRRTHRRISLHGFVRLKWSRYPGGEQRNR